MIKDSRVSLWLGCFETPEEFAEYVDVKYDEDGNSIHSLFQEEFGISRYDQDAIERDWIASRCNDLKALLEGFSCDSEIIPQFEIMLRNEDICKYNSILLLYNFEYENIPPNEDKRMDYIGCVDARKIF